MSLECLKNIKKASVFGAVRDFSWVWLNQKLDDTGYGKEFGFYWKRKGKSLKSFRKEGDVVWFRFLKEFPLFFISYFISFIFYCCSSTVICIYPSPLPHTPAIPTSLLWFYPHLRFVHESFMVVPENPSGCYKNNGLRVRIVSEYKESS